MFVVLPRETNGKAAREPCGPLHGQKHRGGREDREREEREEEEEEEEVEFLGVEGGDTVAH